MLTVTSLTVNGSNRKFYDLLFFIYFSINTMSQADIIILVMIKIIDNVDYIHGV